MGVLHPWEWCPCSPKEYAELLGIAKRHDMTTHGSIAKKTPHSTVHYDHARGCLCFNASPVRQGRDEPTRMKDFKSRLATTAIMIDHKYLNLHYEIIHPGRLDEETGNVEEFKGRIMMSDRDSPEKQIGKVEVHLYSEIDPNQSFYDALDRSFNTVDIADGLFLPESNELNERAEKLAGCTSIPDNFLVIHNIELDPEYRRMGFGRRVMECIERQFAPKCEFFALVADLNNIEALKEFYKECGYKSLKQGKIYYFIKPTSYVNPWI